MSDWADERAREWWTSIDLDKDGAATTENIEVSLAALLREVDKVSACRVITESEYQKVIRAQVLAEVRRVVEEVRDRWEAFHSVCPAVATEILHRLEGL